MCVNRKAPICCSPPHSLFLKNLFEIENDVVSESEMWATNYSAWHLRDIYELSFKFRTQKQEKVTHDLLEELETKIRRFENDLDEENSEEDYLRWTKKREELKKEGGRWVKNW